jgi:hypothetical protein
MSRRSFCLALGVISVLCLGVAAILIGLIRHEPDQYLRPPMPDEPAARQRCSHEFTERILALISAISREDREWDEQFTDEQINSYLDDEFIRSGMDRQLLPDGITRPRVVFGTDSIRLAFRYGTGTWSTVISIDLQVWKAECDTNVVMLKLTGFHAGALPISAQSLLDRVAEVGRQSAIDVSWYRDGGHPVAMLRFGTDQPRTTVILDSLRLQPGSLAVKVRAVEPMATRVMLPQSERGPSDAEN